MLKACLIFVQIFFISAAFSFAQTSTSNLSAIENKARLLYDDLLDSVKVEASRSLENMMAEILSATSVSDFSIDTLKFLKSLTAGDGKFRLISWAWPVSLDQHRYSGFLQLFDKEGACDTVFKFTCNNDTDDLFATLNADEWPGAVYYELVEKESRKGKLYTLFGWMGAGPGKSKRIIEVLGFDQNGHPVFGNPVFVIDPAKIQSRVIFEYTDQIPFHLAYEVHPLPGKKKKKEGMIVFNRLRGNDPQMGRIYNAGVPDYSTFDGFVFTDDNWLLYQDLDLRVNSDKFNNKPPKEGGLAAPKK
jgi:hypothetical protein